MNEPCPKCGEYHNNCFELKNLTDEEIINLWERSGYPNTITGIKKFARAILKKASEK